MKNRWMFFSGAIILLGIWFLSPRSYAEEKKRTSVLGFNFESGAETFAETFTTELRGAVEARLNLGHTGKTQDLEQLALAFGCPETPDPACLKDIGAGLDSTHLIYGTVKKASEKPPYSFQIETHLFIVATGKIEKTTSLLIPADKQGTIYLQEGADRVIAELFNEPPSTTIIVQSNVPGAEIILDESRVGETGSDPLWLRNLEPGKHRIIVKKEGYKIFEKKLEIKKGTRVDVDAPLLKAEEGGTGEEVPIEPIAPTKKKLSWKVWAGAGAIAVGLGLGGGGLYYALKTNSYNGDLEAARGNTTPSMDVCECYSKPPGELEACTGSTPGPSEIDNVKNICDQKTTLMAGQIALFSVGAVVGGVGIYFLVDGLMHKEGKEKKKSEEIGGIKDFNLVPALTPTGGALSVVGSF
jgi:hypothetical protein